MASLHPQLQPFEPTSDRPFDAMLAAHLLSRAGFGGKPEEIAQVMKIGPSRAVDQLLDFPDASAEEQSQTDVPDLSSIDGYPKSFSDLKKMYQGKTQEEIKALRQKIMMANREAIEAVSTWWMRRMANGPHPLQEKLTLFWHGHFTTSAKDEKAATLIWNQNELLRRQSAGNYREFVRQISRDPAMLDYLNNNENRKAHPNENYARELMELFTLGIGNYTETDIKQAARAFTGWAHDDDDFVFRKFNHDTGIKTFFGYSGNFDGDDIIDIILHSKPSMPFISGELFSYFAYDDADPAMIDSLGDVLRDSKFELRPLIRTILKSKAFYSEAALGTQIKSPIQLMVGTTRLLDLQMPPARFLTDSMRQMGQIPLMPPNVKGWPGGRQWINTSTIFVRYNTAVSLVGGGSGGNVGNRGPLFNRLAQARAGGREALDPDRVGPRGTPAQVVDGWVERMIQRPISSEKRSVLLEALGERADDPQSVRRMVQLIVSMPDYQLC
ncbi:MAG: DUF1800 domain-containing protein [Phycisphaerae bacterium]|nr:DUF1800 domain-containing protein [Phycisphaerae bacterium]